MKTLTILKRQQFEDSGSDKTEPRRSKCQRLDEHNNKKKNGLDDEKENGLDEDEGEIEGGRYIPLLFVSLSLLPQKLLNRPSDLGKGTKSLNHIVYISKICYLKSTNFALEFLGRGSSKA